MSDKPSDEHVEYYARQIKEPGYMVCCKQVSHAVWAIWAQKESFPIPYGSKRVKRITPHNAVSETKNK